MGEIIPTPQIVINPLTEVSNQFSLELGLTEQQKQQIVPILKDEITQLQALQKDTKLSGVKKVERLREIGQSFDAKLTPLLNAEQQPKFQAVREALRQRILEKIASEADAKLKTAAEQHVEQMKQDLESLKQKLEKRWSEL